MDKIDKTFTPQGGPIKGPHPRQDRFDKFPDKNPPSTKNPPSKSNSPPKK